MMKSLFFVILIVTYVYSRQIDFGDFDSFNGNNNQQPTTPSGATTTTTASPQYQRCFSDCTATVTKQYNPVCGNNGQSYNNMKLLECAQRCGLRVQYESPGTCGPSPGGK